MDCSTPGFPVHRQLLGLAQTHVHWIRDAIQPSVIPFSPSNHHPLLLPPSIFLSISIFSGESGGQSIGVSTSASVLPMNIQDWFPLGLIGLISLMPKELSRVSSNTTVESINSSALSLLYGQTLTSIHDYWKNHSFDYMDLCGQSDVSAF